MNLTDWISLALAIAGYVLGSIPFGIVVSRMFGTADPCIAGSRNIGFTNVLRVGGKAAGLCTLIGDVGKGWVIAWAAFRTIEPEGLMLAVAATPILGHLYSIFLRFRGGKGVATAIGAVTAVAPIIGLGMVIVWLLTAALWRYSSGAAVAAFLAFPFLAVGIGTGWRFQIFAFGISSLILFRHKANVVRLMKGNEPKIGKRPIAT